MDPEVLAELKAFEAAENYTDPRYSELLTEHHYRYTMLCDCRQLSGLMRSISPSRT